jgi:cytochrome b561
MTYIRNGYSLAQRALHWITVLLVFFNLVFPGRIEHVTDTFDDGGVPNPADLFSANLHVYAGFAILGLTVLRLLLRVVQGAPGKPPGEPDVFHLLGNLSHGLLYAVLIVMPVLGIAKYFFEIDGAGDLHGGPVKVILWVLIGLHVAAVLVHQFWWKTNTLVRMIKGGA